MIKKLLLGAFIVYNVFAMSAYAFAIDTSFAYKAQISDIKLDQKEVIASSDDLKQDNDIFSRVDTDVVATDSIDSQKSADKKPNYEKNNVVTSVVSDVSNSTGCDSTESPSITVLSPNGEEIYTAGQQITVKWASCGVNGNINEINLVSTYDQYGGSTIVKDILNDGEETLNLPEASNFITLGLPFGKYYKIEIVAEGGAVKDKSNNLFTVNAPVNTPSITVLSPNGGEVFQVGQQIPISWVSQNIPSTDYVNIEMTSDIPSTPGVPIPGLRVPNTGSAQWTAFLNANLGWLPGTHFKISIKHYNLNSTIPDALDSSDNLFTIQTPTNVCTINSFTANPTFVPINNPIVLSWATTGCNYIYINNQTANGGNGSTVHPSNGFLGPMTFTLSAAATLLPGCTPMNGYAGYSSNGQPCNSTAQFRTVTVNVVASFCNPNDSTTVPAVDVLSPNGGENFLPVEMPVSWRTCLIPVNTLVSIDLLMSRTGSPDLVRHLATTVNDGAEVVPLPNTTSWPQMVYGNNFKVKISLASGPSYGPKDQSNGNFTIAPSPASVTVTTDSTSPAAGTVLVNNTASTNNVTLLKFKVKATDSDLTIRKIPIQIITNSGNVSSKINAIKLIKDNTVISSISGTSGYLVSGGVITSTPTTGSPTTGYIFGSEALLNAVINAGTIASFTVAVDIKALSGNYNEGDTLTASFANGDTILPSNFSVLDVNGDQLTQTQRSGFAQGQIQVLRTSTLSVVMGTPLIMVAVSIPGGVTELMYSIPLTVSSVGATKYIGRSAQLATTATGSNSFAYVFNTAQNPTLPDTTSIGSSTLISYDAMIEGNAYKLDDGTSKHFTLNVTLTTPATPNSNYRVALQQLRAFNNSSLTNGPTNFDLTPASSYQTQFAFINN